jgi:hypothetical protein
MFIKNQKVSQLQFFHFFEPKVFWKSEKVTNKCQIFDFGKRSWEK